MAAAGGSWKGGNFVAAGNGGSIAWVSAIDAETANLPSIPDNIGSREKPLRLGRSQLAFREGGTWFFNSPNSQWMGGQWLRGDNIFQRQMTLGYRRSA